MNSYVSNYFWVDGSTVKVYCASVDTEFCNAADEKELIPAANSTLCEGGNCQTDVCCQDSNFFIKT